MLLYTMSKKAKIEFSEDGTQATVIFRDGSKSESFKSQLELREALANYAIENKVNAEEYAEIKETVMSEKRFPKGERTQGPRIIILDISTPGKIKKSDGFGFLSFLIGIAELMAEEKEDLKEAYFSMCRSGEDHGHIYVRVHGRVRGIITSKEMGFNTIETLKSENTISEEESEKLTKEIKDSPLPETEDDAMKAGGTEL